MKIAAASVSLGLPLLLAVANAQCPPSFSATNRGGTAGGAPAASLLSSIEALRSHVQGNVILDDEGIISAAEDFTANYSQLTSSIEILTAALSLVEEYEDSSYGPMFLNDRFTKETFSSIAGTDDGLEIDRAIMLVQQGVLDEVYHGSLWGPHERGSDPVDLPYKPLIKECQVELRGRKWQTAAYMPGWVDPPADSTVEHTVKVNATFPEVWGRPTSLSNPETGLSRRIHPLGGLYLAPGGIASITVPVALAGAGYTVQVGSQAVNQNRKTVYARMHRLTTAFPVDEATTFVAHPMGGELFLRSPYGSTAGVVDVVVSGDVVESASFFLTSLKETSEEEWNATSAQAPAPWVSIESDNYLLSVPSNWVNTFDYSHMHTLLSNYTAIMNAVTTLNGIPPERRNNHVLYESLSRIGRAGAAGIGYPQCNTPVTGTPNGPKLGGHHGQPGQADTWLVRDPLGHNVPGIRHSSTSQHELGHTNRYRYSCYPGEKESIVHVGSTYARNVVYGDSIDESFKLSIGYQNPIAHAPVMSVDRAAIDWMVRENFRAGNPMDTKYETPYQHRGHAKYADLARLLGWDVFKNFYHSEHLEYNAVGEEPDFCPDWDSSMNSDCRTLRLSIEAGEDLTPFIHFWGVHPVNEALLKEKMLENNLYPSRTVKKQLLRYATIVPKNGTEFYNFGDELWIPDTIKKCGSSCRFYQETPWNETLHDDVVDAVIDIISRYWPVGDACTTTRQRRTGALRSNKQLDRIAEDPSPSGKRRNLEGMVELSAARAKWESNGSPPNYDFELQNDDFERPEDEIGPFLVRVRHGVMVGATYTETGMDVDLDLIDDIPTVGELFDIIEDGLKDGFYEDVAYNHTMGYPMEIYALNPDEDDDEDGGGSAGSDFLDIYVSNFRTLGAGGEPCENKEDCVSNECLGSGVCDEPSA